MEQRKGPHVTAAEISQRIIECDGDRLKDPDVYRIVLANLEEFVSGSQDVPVPISLLEKALYETGSDDEEICEKSDEGDSLSKTSDETAIVPADTNLGIRVYSFDELKRIEIKPKNNILSRISRLSRSSRFNPYKNSQPFFEEKSDNSITLLLRSKADYQCLTSRGFLPEMYDELGTEKNFSGYVNLSRLTKQQKQHLICAYWFCIDWGDKKFKNKDLKNEVDGNLTDWLRFNKNTILSHATRGQTKDMYESLQAAKNFLENLNMVGYYPRVLNELEQDSYSKALNFFCEELVKEKTDDLFNRAFELSKLIETDTQQKKRSKQNKISLDWLNNPAQTLDYVAAYKLLSSENAIKKEVIQAEKRLIYELLTEKEIYKADDLFHHKKLTEFDKKKQSAFVERIRTLVDYAELHQRKLSSNNSEEIFKLCLGYCNQLDCDNSINALGNILSMFGCRRNGKAEFKQLLGYETFKETVTSLLDKSMDSSFAKTWGWYKGSLVKNVAYKKRDSYVFRIKNKEFII